MAKAARKTSRGRSRDRKRVAARQDYEVRYEAKKARRSKTAVSPERRPASAAGCLLITRNSAAIAA
jgi:hypothetical protein